MKGRRYNIVAELVEDICKVKLVKCISGPERTVVGWETSDEEQLFLKRKDFYWMYYKICDRKIIG